MKATETQAPPKNPTRLPAGVKVSALGMDRNGRAIRLLTLSLAQHEDNRARREFKQLTPLEKLVANLSRTLDHEDLFPNERQAAKSANFGGGRQ